MKMLFRYKFFSEVLQQTLQSFLKDGHLCDVTLVVDGHEFQAHKLILSAASPYFRTMFNSESSFIESKQNKITLHGIDRGALLEILNFIYSSNIQINCDNVYALMEATDLLQIHTLRAFISLYLQKSLGVENCLHTYAMANLFQYHELANNAFYFLLTNFSDVASRDEFLELPLDILLKILSSRLLNVPNEETLYEHLLRWVTADLEKRKHYLDKLIFEVDINFLSIDCLNKIKNDPLISINFREKFEEILNHPISRSGMLHVFGKEKKYFYQNGRHKAEKAVLFAIGGESSGMASQSVECFSLGYHKWRYVVPECILKKQECKYTNVLPPMRCARYYAAFTSDSYNVYVLGGRNSSTSLDECEVFNVRTNQWKYFHKLPIKLFGSGAAFLENELFVVGGYSEEGPLNKMWKLDKVHDSWISVASLNSPRFFHGTVSAGGYIFVLGGYDNDNHLALRTCEKFDPSTNKWFPICSMHYNRAKFGCAVIDEFIYVFGGTSRENDCLKSVERYNIITNEWWVYKPSMLMPRHSFSVAVARNDIYCMGGSDCTHFLDTVEKFNVRTGRWHCVHSMQISRLAPAAAALLIPYTSTE